MPWAVALLMAAGCSQQRPRTAPEDMDAATGLRYGEYYTCGEGKSRTAEGYFHRYEKGVLYLSQDTLFLTPEMGCEAKRDTVFIVRSNADSVQAKPVGGSKANSTAGSIAGVAGKAVRAAAFVAFFPISLLMGERDPCKDFLK